MENKFYVNIIHRPELSPEYAEKAMLGAKNVQDESLDIFLFQQDCAHKYGLKTTIQITYASLFSKLIIDIAKEHHLKYGDEIGLSLLGLPCKEFREKYRTEDFCIWMFSDEDKERIIDDVFGKFYQAFGFYPESTGSYFLDSYTINYIKKKYPSVKCAIATCWEEGPKAYHTCNNSWYTFMDGGPWNPWIPSKINSHCPAINEEDDCGLVAIPHLSRDLLACFDGNGSNFGTHPQNVLRGMIYYNDNGSIEYPYLYNLIDEYRHLAKYNNGYSYNMMFVGPGWLNKRGRWESPYSVLAKSYDDGCKYYGKLKDEGKLTCLTMSEFAEVYRKEHKDYKQGECALWKDILYGSNKQYFWYASPYYRLCLDFNQGGAVIDYRPYASRVPQEIGIGHKEVYDASYPYLIQANYRAGFFTHYAGAGTTKSCIIEYKGYKADLCLLRTMASFERVSDGVIVKTNKEKIKLGDLDIEIESIFKFQESDGKLIVTRRILNELKEEVKLTEYFTGGYGTNEYQKNMNSVHLGIDDLDFHYKYKGRKLTQKGTKAYAVIPNIQTKLVLEGKDLEFEAEEGIAFSPVYHLRASKTLKKGDLVTCLYLQKEN